MEANLPYIPPIRCNLSYVKIQLQPCLFKSHSMEVCEGVEDSLHAFLTSPLGRSYWAASCLTVLSTGKDSPVPNK